MDMTYVEDMAAMRAQLVDLIGLVRLLIAQRTIKDFYTPKEFAEIVTLSTDQLRDHLRNRRILGERRPGTGRGNKPEWRIAHAELVRYQNEGLRPRPAFVA